MKLLITNDSITFEVANKNQYTHKIDDLITECIDKRHCAVTQGCNVNCPLYPETTTTAECYQILTAIMQYQYYKKKTEEQ